MNLDTLRTKYKSQILDIARQYKAEDIRVFGSVIRGEENENSDIDFLVRFQPGVDLFDIGGMHSDLVDLLECNVDILSEKAISPHIKDDILHDARPL